MPDLQSFQWEATPTECDTQKVVMSHQYPIIVWSGTHILSPSQSSHLFFPLHTVVVTIIFRGTEISSILFIVYLQLERRSVLTRKHKAENIPSGSLGLIVSGSIFIFTPWFPSLWILTESLWERIPYTGLWFKAYTTFWRSQPQPDRLLTPKWHFNSSFLFGFCSPRSLGSRGKNASVRRHNKHPLKW